MNPYDQIDNRRCNPGNINPPAPLTELPQIMRPIWRDFYHAVMRKAIGLVSNGKPDPNVIYTFNILSKGNPPFVNDTTCGVATECAIVYLAHLKKNNTTAHNESLAREIIDNMLNMYCWAIVTQDQNLRNMVANNHQLVSKAKEAYATYTKLVSDATNFLQSNNNGWSSSNNNNGWSNSSGNDGWGNDNSWGASNAMSHDLLAVNTSWDEPSNNNSGWGSNSADINQSSWEISTDSWGDETSSNTSNTTKENNMDNLTDIEKAIRLAMMGDEEKAEEAPAHAISKGASNVQTVVEEESQWGEEWSWEGEEEVTDPTTVFESAAAIEDEETTTYLVIDLAPVKGIDTSLAAITDQHRDEAQYVKDVLERFGGLPEEVRRIDVDGYDHFVLPESSVLLAPQFASDSLRRRLCTTLPVEGAGDRNTCYLINKNMEFVEIMIDLSGHDIYEAISDDTATTLAKLANLNKEEVVGEEKFQPLVCAEVAENVMVSTRSEMFLELQARYEEMCSGDEYNAVRINVNTVLGKLGVIGTGIGNINSHTLVVGAMSAISGISERQGEVFSTMLMRYFNTVLFNATGIERVYSNIDDFREGLIEPKSPCEDFNDEEFKSIVSAISCSIGLVEENSTGNSFVVATHSVIYSDAFSELEELLEGKPNQRFRIPLFMIEGIETITDVFNIPVRIVFPNQRSVTLYSISDGWLYLTYDDLV